MQRRASRTNPRDAEIAVTHARMHKRVQEKCLQLFVLSAAQSAKCPSSPPKVRQFTAAHALLQRRTRKYLKQAKENNAFTAVFSVEQYEIENTYRQEKDEKLLKFLVLFS